VTNQRPLVFLDFDDVIVVNLPGRACESGPIAQNLSKELAAQLFYRPAAAVLVDALHEHDAHVVITSSWLRLMLRESFEKLLTMAGLGVVSQSFHEHWEAPQHRGETRAQAIERWLALHHRGEPYVILDDDLSGTGLRRSVHARSRRLVMCKVGVGLHTGHSAAIRAALGRQCKQDRTASRTPD